MNSLDENVKEDLLREIKVASENNSKIINGIPRISSSVYLIKLKSICVDWDFLTIHFSRYTNWARFKIQIESVWNNNMGVIHSERAYFTDEEVGIFGKLEEVNISSKCFQVGNSRSVGIRYNVRVKVSASIPFRPEPFDWGVQGWICISGNRLRWGLLPEID